MRIACHQDHLHLTFNSLERRLLKLALESIRHHYTLPPSDLDRSIASVWYSTRGCASAGMNPDETQEWIAHLHGYRGQHLPLIENWLAQLTRDKAPAGLNVSMDHAPVFLTVVNDHRLLLAATHDLANAGIDTLSWDTVESMPSVRRNAVLELELLGYLMEGVLQCLPNSGADWRNSVSP